MNPSLSRKDIRLLVSKVSSLEARFAAIESRDAENYYHDKLLEIANIVGLDDRSLAADVVEAVQEMSDSVEAAWKLLTDELSPEEPGALGETALEAVRELKILRARNEMLTAKLELLVAVEVH